MKNHPLSKIYATEIEVWVYIFDGQVIGGTSFPTDDSLSGWGYSLDGKTAEEVQDNNLAEWIRKWNKKYGQ